MYRVLDAPIIIKVKIHFGKTYLEFCTDEVIIILMF